jgi:hypothetical protein
MRFFLDVKVSAARAFNSWLTPLGSAGMRLVKVPAGGQEEDAPSELFDDVEQRSDDSEITKMWKFALRQTERFARQYAVAVAVPETQSGVVPRIISEDDVNAIENGGKLKIMFFLIQILHLICNFLFRSQRQEEEAAAAVAPADPVQVLQAEGAADPHPVRRAGHQEDPAAGRRLPAQHCRPAQVLQAAALLPRVLGARLRLRRHQLRGRRRRRHLGLHLRQGLLRAQELRGAEPGLQGADPHPAAAVSGVAPHSVLQAKYPMR